MWRITIYRRDSQTKIIYENVKHAWWDGELYKIAQFTEAGMPTISGSGDGTHHYWTWPLALISHIKEERV